MAQISGVVYTPPGPQFPLIAVLFGPDGEVLTARAVPTVAAGEKLIYEVLSSVPKPPIP
jgi:hypothetical protein